MATSPRYALNSFLTSRRHPDLNVSLQDGLVNLAPCINLKARAALSSAQSRGRTLKSWIAL